MLQRSHLFIWIGIIGVPLLFLCLVHDILFPFVVSFIIAYFLHPTVNRIHRYGISRTIATFGIMSIFFIILGSILVFLLPALYGELITLATKIPEYITLAKTEFFPKLDKFLDRFSPNLMHKLMDNLGNLSSYLITFLINVSKNIITSGATLVNILSLIFITPVITFYVLRDWNKIMTHIPKLCPPAYTDTIHEQISLIDRTLSGYLRGQIHVCFILSIYYVIGLALIGLDFSLFIGIMSGMLAFIPYVGILVGLATGLVIAFLQYGDLLHLLLVLTVFATGQALEGAVFTPRLVGNQVGLHPVWIIFGLFAGGSLFGFTGILLAIPITAVIGILVRFGISKYLASSLFRKKKTRSKTYAPS
jgi:predicted PurR-regulated permease PerM